MYTYYIYNDIYLYTIYNGVELVENMKICYITSL